MREIDVSVISEAVAELCVAANKKLPCDITARLKSFADAESDPTAKNVLSDICLNCDIADELGIPICQDTGMAVVFLDIGQDVHFIGGDLITAVNAGVARGYDEGLLRKSVVADPLRRGNTDDNTPAVVHLDIVPGEKVKIIVAPKGFGSENMSAVKMLTPFDSREGVVDFVLDTVRKAASNPCPPMVIGVGIGGDFEQCAFLAKKALCRSTDVPNADGYYREFEAELLEKINKLNIGPQGFGGDTTALAVNVETAPTHIAGLPVAVNVGCYVTRHQSREV